MDVNAIYWVDEVGGEVARAPKRGGLTMTLDAAAGTTFSPGSSVAVAAGDVYWISDTEQEAGPRQSSLRRLEKNGGKPTTIASSTTSRLYGPSFDDTNVYWVTGGAVMRAPKDRGRHGVRSSRRGSARSRWRWRSTTPTRT